MYCVFNKVLQSDMSKTIGRKYAPSLDAQSVWRDFESHMSTSSQGLNERHRLHTYVSTTVYDKSWKDTTEHFVLHFHKQFDRIPSTTPGAEPPRDAKDSGSARSHSMHLETSSSNRP